MLNTIATIGKRKKNSKDTRLEIYGERNGMDNG